MAPLVGLNRHIWAGLDLVVLLVGGSCIELTSQTATPQLSHRLTCKSCELAQGRTYGVP